MNPRFALRLTAAFVGIITVAATYWLGRELFPDRARGRDIGLFAAALLAASFAHVLFSRLGFRAITQPLLRDDHRRPAARHTHTTMALARRRWRVSGIDCLCLPGSTSVSTGDRGGIATLCYGHVRGSAGRRLVCFSPLRCSLLRRYWVILCAIRSVFNASTRFRPNPAADSATTFIRSFGMFLCRAIPYWRFNIPGKPLLGIVIGLTAIAGWAWLLTRWRQWRAPWARAALLVPLFAPLIGALADRPGSGEKSYRATCARLALCHSSSFCPLSRCARLVIWLPLHRPSLGHGLSSVGHLSSSASSSPPTVTSISGPRAVMFLRE